MNKAIGYYLRHDYRNADINFALTVRTSLCCGSSGSFFLNFGFKKFSDRIRDTIAEYRKSR